MVVGHVCSPKKRFRCPPSSHREPLDPYFTLLTPPCSGPPSSSRVSRFINNTLVHPAPGVPPCTTRHTLLFVESRPSLRHAHPNRHPTASSTNADRTPSRFEGRGERKDEGRRRRVPTDDTAQRRKQATQQRSESWRPGTLEAGDKRPPGPPSPGALSLQVPAYGPPLDCRKGPSAAGDETKRSSNAAGAAPSQAHSHCDTSLTPFGFGN